jgi:hypothetical protein
MLDNYLASIGFQPLPGVTDELPLSYACSKKHKVPYREEEVLFEITREDEIAREELKYMIKVFEAANGGEFSFKRLCILDTAEQVKDYFGVYHFKKEENYG